MFKLSLSFVQWFFTLFGQRNSLAVEMNAGTKIMRPNSFGPLPPRTKMPNLLTLFPGGRNSVWFGQEIMPKNNRINVLAGSQVGSDLCCRFEKLVWSEDDTGLKTTIPRVSCSLCQPGGHVIQAHVFPKSARKRRLRGL